MWIKGQQKNNKDSPVSSENGIACTYAISQYNNIQNLSRYLVLHHNTIQYHYMAQPYAIIMCTTGRIDQIFSATDIFLN